MLSGFTGGGVTAVIVPVYVNTDDHGAVSAAVIVTCLVVQSSVVYVLSVVVEK